jgi:phage-related protein
VINNTIGEIITTIAEYDAIAVDDHIVKPI